MEMPCSYIKTEKENNMKCLLSGRVQDLNYESLYETKGRIDVSLQGVEPKGLMMMELAALLLRKDRGKPISFIDITEQEIIEKYPEVRKVYLPLCEQMFPEEKYVYDSVYFQNRSEEHLYCVQDLLNLFEELTGDKYTVKQYMDKLLFNPERYPVQEIVEHHNYWGLYTDNGEEKCIAYGYDAGCYILSTEYFLSSTADLRCCYIDTRKLITGIDLGSYIVKADAYRLYVENKESLINTTVN